MTATPWNPCVQAVTGNCSSVTEAGTRVNRVIPGGHVSPVNTGIPGRVARLGWSAFSGNSAAKLPRPGDGWENT